MRQAFYVAPDKIDPQTLGAVYFIASKIKHPRLAALRSAILAVEQGRFARAVNVALGLEAPPELAIPNGFVQDCYNNLHPANEEQPPRRTEGLVDRDVQCDPPLVRTFPPIALFSRSKHRFNDAIRC